VYAPPTDANATTFGGTVPLTVNVTDAQGAGGGTTVNVTVNPVNDVPSFTLAGNPPTVNEDDGPQTVANFATNIVAGPATATDEAGQALNFMVTGNTNAALFSAGPAVSSTGTLTYTLAPNASGTATITLVLVDGGGGTDTSSPQTFTITANPTSDAPAGADNTVTTLEDTPHTFGAADFGFTDPTDAPADAFAGVVVTTLPASGTLRNNGAAVTAGQFVSAADIAAGNLTFTPALNATATTTFTFQVRDAGSTANGGAVTDPTPNTLSAAVTPVNDEPTVTLAAPAVTVNQDSGAFSQTNFATFAPGGGADEAGQAPTYAVTNTNNALFTAAGQPALDATGTLTFTPAPGMSGTVTITVTVTDSGSNVAPNDNTGASQQFTLTVLVATASPAPPAPGLSVASGAQLIAVGTDAGVPAQVRVLDARTGAVIRDFFPFGLYFGGVRVAVADMTGDGTDDIVVATASQFGLVAIFDGVTGTLVRTFLPFGPLPSGVQIATGDLDGDGRQDLVIGLDALAPIVVAISGRTGEVMRVINAIPGFGGGVRLAVGDVTGDGKADITTIAGPGGNGLVVTYDGSTGGVAGAFFAYPGLLGEVNLAMGDVTGDGLLDLVTGVQVGGGTFIGVFTPSGQLARNFFVPTGAGSQVRVGPSSLVVNQAARIATADVNGDRIADLLIGDPPGALVSRMIVISGANGETLQSRLPFDPLFGSGLFVDAN
jgi:hypothetical protein